MITDNIIDEKSARYWCIVTSTQIKRVANAMQDAAHADNDEKTGMQFAIASGLDDRRVGEAACTQSEKFLVQLLESYAWVEEPTGFNLARPKDVFKNDVKGGLAGYNTGVKRALATAGAAIAAANPATTAAAAKNVAKFMTKYPKTALTAGIAALNPAGAIKAAKHGADVAKSAVELAKNGAKEVSWLQKLLKKLEPAFDKACKFFKPVTDIVMKHPIGSIAAGAACYGIFATRSLWMPYMRRLKYGMTSGQRLAAVKFNADGDDYTFEYRLKLHRWVLFEGNVFADAEDAASFIKTKFAQKFIAQCTKNIETLFKDKDMLLAQAAMTHDNTLVKQLDNVFDNEGTIRATMFTQKMKF